MSLSLVERHVLDELCLQPDPVPWHEIAPRLRRHQPALERTFEALIECVNHGLVCACGLRVRRGASALTHMAKEWIFTATPRGRAYWADHVQGRVVRDQQTNQRAPVPRHGLAAKTAAVAPREVWDLSDVSWHWHKGQDARDADAAHAAKLARRRASRIVPADPGWSKSA